MNDQYHRFRIGSMNCIAVSDGYKKYETSRLVAGAPPEEMKREVERWGQTVSEIVTP